MNKKEKAFEYAKMRYGNNGNETQNEIAKMIACRVGYEAGWDEALKNKWTKVEDELPERMEEVFVIYEYQGYIQIATSCYIGEIVWYFGNSKIIAWMPIPSFDEILESNKDVLKRLKDI